eukprot:TRINITY_DN1843_c0_g3_i1.p1 TRINITY_DN1843_c0_g3~~TRINITY_DN1843_c0_g3_i1.p1  ORF type:complete len:467 (-),score=139.04 TRINITY_DN1843_c0_g3_i1:262-1662(-)
MTDDIDSSKIKNIEYIDDINELKKYCLQRLDAINLKDDRLNELLDYQFQKSLGYEDQITLKSYKINKQINEGQKDLIELIQNVFNEVVNEFEDTTKDSLTIIIKEFTNGINFLSNRLDNQLSTDRMYEELMKKFNLLNTQNLLEISKILESKLNNRALHHSYQIQQPYPLHQQLPPQPAATGRQLELREIKDTLNDVLSTLFASIQRYVDQDSKNSTEVNKKILDKLQKSIVSKVEHIFKTQFKDYLKKNEEGLKTRVGQLSHQYSELKNAVSLCVTNVSEIHVAHKKMNELNNNLVDVNNKLVDSNNGLQEKVQKLQNENKGLKIELHELKSLHQRSLEQNKQILTLLNDIQREQWTLKDRITRDRMHRIPTKKTNNKRKKEPVEISDDDDEYEDNPTKVQLKLENRNKDGDELDDETIIDDFDDEKERNENNTRNNGNKNKNKNSQRSSNPFITMTSTPPKLKI